MSLWKLTGLSSASADAQGKRRATETQRHRGGTDGRKRVLKFINIEFALPKQRDAPSAPLCLCASVAPPVFQFSIHRQRECGTVLNDRAVSDFRFRAQDHQARSLLGVSF